MSTHANSARRNVLTGTATTAFMLCGQTPAETPPRGLFYD